MIDGESEVMTVLRWCA